MDTSNCVEDGIKNGDLSPCFKFYLNLWGIGFENMTNPDHFKQMKILSGAFGAYTIFVIMLIIYLQVLAYRKHKKINKFFDRINDSEFAKLYSPITHKIVYLC